MVVRRIDLNSDLGEGFGPVAMDGDASMLDLVTSANIACGGHAGDSETMHHTLTLAAQRNVRVGAHPGYVDRQGFGRRIIPMSHEEIQRMVAAQVGALRAIAALVPVEVTYVKTHGALANLAAADRGVADAIVETVQRIDPSLAVLAISGTEIERAARAASVPVYSEIFADRGYLSNGQLVPRGNPGDLIDDAGAAADRIVEFLETGSMPVVDGDPIPLDAASICVHGDSAGAVAMTRSLRERLTAAGVELAPFIASP